MHEELGRLRVNIGGIEVGADIDISVLQVEKTPGAGGTSPVTRVRFEWKAKQSPHLFPLMRAELSVYPADGE